MSPDHPSSPWPAVTASALAYAVLHHGGTWFSHFGEVGGSATRWADWFDLATPFAVLLPVFVALRAARAGRRPWALVVVGTILYTQGHGIHLSANSIGNVVGASAEPVHLWDEVVGHYLWYAGLALVVVALAGALAERPVPRRWWRLPLAGVVGLTWGTNGLEGGTAPASLLVALAAVAWWLRRRTGTAGLLAVAGGVAALVLIAWGLRYGGFPQPSQVGWP